MCGINGIISLVKSLDLNSKISEMNAAIFHRGPDSDGEFVAKENHFSIAMGMRRLSIIDLSSGKQPIFSSDNQKVIVFNGEIYNYNLLCA